MHHSPAALIFLAVFPFHNNTYAFSSHNINKNLDHKIILMSSSLLDTDALAVEANSFASANGIQVERRKTKEEQNHISYEGAPMSLLPNAYPKSEFKKACDVAPAFNELVDRVSRDDKFLEDTLGGGVSEIDPFTAKILELYRKVYVDDSDTNAPAKIADKLGIHRSDYMLHCNSNDNSYQIKQVELNTIASSFAGLSCKIANMHRFLTSRYAKECEEFLQINRKRVTMNENVDDASSQLSVPVNPALEELAFAMKVAYDRYVERFVVEAKETFPPVVLFVVQEVSLFLYIQSFDLYTVSRSKRVCFYG